LGLCRLVVVLSSGRVACHGFAVKCMDKLPRGAWEDLMDEADMMIPSAPGSQADNSFQREVHARLLSIEAKLDSVARQFMKHDNPPMAVASPCYSSSDKLAGTTLGKENQVDRASPPCILPHTMLPCTCPDETEADQASALANSLKSSPKVRGKRHTSSKASSSSSCSNSSDSGRVVKIKTRHMPHVGLDRGSTWVREGAEEEGALSRNNTLTRLSRRYGIHGTLQRFALLMPAKHNQEEIDYMKTQRLWCFVHSSLFRALCSTMVILNVLFVGVLTEVELQDAQANRLQSKLWTIGNSFFCIFFLIEILLRLLAERKLFFTGDHVRWNIFDTLVVTMSVMDVAFDISGDSSPTQNMVVARILRFSRLLRVVSVARVMRACQSLRLVVLTIFETMSELVWCFLVLGIIIFTFAIFTVQGVTAQLRWQNENGATPEKLQERAELLELFGSIPAAAICLFMMVSGGLDWRDAMLPMKKVHDLYEYFFTLYVFFMVIGVLNVVVGAFVAATGEIANRDRDLIVKAEMAHLSTYLEKVRTFFSEADVDCSGKLSLTEFKSHLDDKNVCAYLHALGIDVSQGEILFHLLDTDDSHVVSLNEFLAGCLRLRGHAKSLDVNLLLHETRQLARRVDNLRDSIDPACQSKALGDS